MSEFWSIIFILLCWIISFVEPSGWSEETHFTEHVNYIFLIIGGLFILKNQLNWHRYEQRVWSGIFVACMILTMMIIPYTMSNGISSWSYMIAFVVTYITSKCTITQRLIRITGICYALAGLVILLIYTNGELLSGWNDNAMAMVGLFSFLYFCTYLVIIRHTNSFLIWNIITLLFISLLFKTDSRSGMLFSVLAILAIIFRDGIGLFFSKRRNQFLLLNIPIIIAFIVVQFAKTGIFKILNLWSLESFEKPLFNGREELWLKAWDYLVDSHYLGTGEFLINYHNSGMAALSVFGILGYIVWIKYFSKTLAYINNWIFDEIIFGCVLSFFLIFLQQSVELGFIGPVPNLIPYVILGMGLGRARMLQNNE